ncbi:unnamed protein product [Calypogeia fissa]
MADRLSIAIVTILSVLLAQKAILSVKAQAHATFYGGTSAEGTMNGACGYTNLYTMGYGTMTTALSNALFQGGRTCGACYQISCYGSNCYSGSITVTATNLCPQGSYGGWCDGSNKHFDLSYPAFSKIARPSAGVVTVTYNKVACRRSGGIKFWIQGHTYYLLVTVYNVGGNGDINSVSVKGSRTGWIYMTRTWGVNFSTGQVLDKQGLSFEVTDNTGRTSYSDNCVGTGWSYGQTYQGSNF